MRKNTVLPGLVLVIFVICSLLATGATAEWTIEKVDEAKSFHQFSSRAIAVDTGNHPHIAYGGDYLYYAYCNGNAWHYETIDSSTGVGSFASIALDASGKVHISYYDEYNGDLKYATNVSGSWKTQIVDRAGDIGEYTSIALDTSGKVHISYYDKDNEDLKYATNASGFWQTQTVDSDRRVGSYTLIALDGSCKAHISYYDEYNDAFKYATNMSGSWQTQTVDSAGDIGSYTSIALDTSGKVHISYHWYCDWKKGVLRYATNASGSWQTQTIDGEGYVGSYASIALDAFDEVHISYYDEGNENLKYTTNISGSWKKETVDSEGIVGLDTSIAIDKSGKVHISYYDWDTNDLKYATNAPVPKVPDLTVTPESYSFGDISVGSFSAPLVITLSNQGKEDLVISGMSLSDPDNFLLNVGGGPHPFGWATPTIAPRGSGTIVVIFTPASAGEKSATLTISSNDPDTPNMAIPLSGNIEPPPPPTTLDRDIEPPLSSTPMDTNKEPPAVFPPATDDSSSSDGFSLSGCFLNSFQMSREQLGRFFEKKR